MVDQCSMQQNQQTVVVRDGSTTSVTTEDSCGRAAAGAARYILDPQVIQDAAHRVNPDLLYKIPCIPVHCGFGLVQVKAKGTMPLQAMIQKECRTVGGKLTVLFAIRRPGCGACREHALQLTALDQIERDVSFIGAVKETGAPNTDKALLEFYQQYFRFPIVWDKKWDIFKAMGGRKVGLWQALTSVPRLNRRFKSKGFPNVMGGDTWTQGGVLVFDKRGNLRHTYYETFGELLDLQVLRAAIREARTPLTTTDEASSSL